MLPNLYNCLHTPFQFLSRVYWNSCTCSLAGYPLMSSRKPVLYSVDHSFPSDSPKQCGRWVGMAESQGGAQTNHILTNNTSPTRSSLGLQSIPPLIPPIQIYVPHPSPTSGDGESPSTPIILSDSDLSSLNIETPHFSPADKLLGLTFICYVHDGGKYRGTVA
jgi:hypothetical protein